MDHILAINLSYEIHDNDSLSLLI